MPEATQSASFQTSKTYERLETTAHQTADLGEVWAKINPIDHKPTGKIVGFADMTQATADENGKTSKKIKWGKEAGNFLKVKVALKDRQQTLTIRNNGKTQKFVLPAKSDYYAAAAGGKDVPQNTDAIELEFKLTGSGDEARWAPKLYARNQDKTEEHPNKLSENDNFRAAFKRLNKLSHVTADTVSQTKGYDLRGQALPPKATQASLKESETPTKQSSKTPPLAKPANAPSADQSADTKKRNAATSPPTTQTRVKLPNTNKPESNDSSQTKPTPTPKQKPKIPTQRKPAAPKPPPLPTITEETLSEMEFQAEKEFNAHSPQNPLDEAVAIRPSNFLKSMPQLKPNPQATLSEIRQQALVLPTVFNELKSWSEMGCSLLEKASQRGSGEQLYKKIDRAAQDWQSGLSQNQRRIQALKLRLNKTPRTNQEPLRKELDQLAKTYSSLFNQVSALRTQIKAFSPSAINTAAAAVKQEDTQSSLRTTNNNRRSLMSRIFNLDRKA